MNNIRKVAVCLSLCLVFLLGITSCGKGKAELADKSLTELVAGLKFPQKVNNNISITDCKYSDKELKITYEVNKKAFKKIDAEKLSTEAQERLKSELLPRSFSKKLITDGASLNFVFVNGNDSISITFSPEDLTD